MNCSQRLGEFVKETIVLVDLVSDLLVISFGMIMETLTCEKVANEQAYNLLKKLHVLTTGSTLAKAQESMCGGWIVNDNIEDLRAKEVCHVAPHARTTQGRARSNSATGTSFFTLSCGSISAAHSLHPTRRRASPINSL